MQAGEASLEDLVRAILFQIAQTMPFGDTSFNPHTPYSDAFGKLAEKYGVPSVTDTYPAGEGPPIPAGRIRNA